MLFPTYPPYLANPTCHQFLCVLRVYQLDSTHRSHRMSLSSSQNLHFIFSQAPQFTFIQQCWAHATLKKIIFVCSGNLLPLSNSPHSLNFIYLTLAVTIASHPRLTFALSPNSRTLSQFQPHHIILQLAPVLGSDVKLNPLGRLQFGVLEQRGMWSNPLVLIAPRSVLTWIGSTSVGSSYG